MSCVFFFCASVCVLHSNYHCGTYNYVKCLDLLACQTFDYRRWLTLAPNHWVWCLPKNDRTWSCCWNTKTATNLKIYDLILYFHSHNASLRHRALCWCRKRAHAMSVKFTPQDFLQRLSDCFIVHCLGVFKPLWLHTEHDDLWQGVTHLRIYCQI